MEEDGVNYSNDFPINLNTFSYKNQEDYLIEDGLPEDKVIEIIIENNLLDELLYTYYQYPHYDEHYKFISIVRAINALDDKGLRFP